MKTFLISLMLMLSTAVLADGFKCEQLSHEINIDVFNHTKPTDGTRNVAVLIISDARLNYGEQTIAKFSANKETLRNKATSYVAKVDMSGNGATVHNKKLLGIKLAEIREILIDINFNYSVPLYEGQVTDGFITVVKNNGTIKLYDLMCTRYLKR